MNCPIMTIRDSLQEPTGQVGRIQNKGTEAAEEGINEAVMREAVIMQMTWPGAPTVYYGDEVGVCGLDRSG